MRFHYLLALILWAALGAAPPALVREGKGPVVVFIHGFGGNREVWAEVAKDLAKDHTVIRVNLPGSGGSAGPALAGAAADLEAIAKDLTQMVRREKGAPCLLVGHSMGGPIGALAVLQDPKAFRGLVLVDSFLSSVPAAYFEATLAGLEIDPKAALAAFFGPMSANPAQTKRLVAEGLRVPVPTLQAYLRAMTQDFMHARHGHLTLPVIQLAAGPKEGDPVKQAEQLAQFGLKELPNLRVLNFPKAKHWVMWDEPVAFVEVLRKIEADLDAR